MVALHAWPKAAWSNSESMPKAVNAPGLGGHAAVELRIC